MHDNINISFQHTDCPEENLLMAYHNNTLSKGEIRNIELHLADCEMCNDYLEGLSLLSGTQELEKEASFVISEINNDRSKKNRLWLYAAAASVFLGISIFTFIWFMPVKNNFVAQEITIADKTAEDSPPPPPPTDSIDTGVNGLFKNSTEAEAGDNLNDKQVQQQLIKTVDATGKAAYTQDVVIVEKDIPVEESYAKVSESPGMADNSIVSDLKKEAKFSEKLDEDQDKTRTGENQTLAGGVGVTTASTLIAQEEEKVEKGYKADKKNKESSKQKDARSVSDEVAASEQSAVPNSKNESPSRVSNIDDFENSESNLDLDKAAIFYRQQMADSAVVYALRATTSCDSCKWSALLLLSKSYIKSGQTEKAVAALKEVKSKGPAKFSKEAKLELEKLGY